MKFPWRNFLSKNDLQLCRYCSKLLSLAKIGAAPPGYREKYLIGRLSCQIEISRFVSATG
jgi:hypothetical protein